jgi:hypothetical protein
MYTNAIIANPGTPTIYARDVQNADLWKDINTTAKANGDETWKLCMNSSRKKTDWL